MPVFQGFLFHGFISMNTKRIRDILRIPILG